MPLAQRSLSDLQVCSHILVFSVHPLGLRFEAAEERQRQRVLKARAAAFLTAGKASGSKDKTTSYGGGGGGGRKLESQRGRRKVNCGTFMAPASDSTRWSDRILHRKFKSVLCAL